MKKKKVLYFSYGSNMLLQRLQDRCPSAKILGVAWATGYYLTFGKKGLDGTGKAAIVRTGARDDIVHGVLFEIFKSEMKQLDSFELNYLRNDEFRVHFQGKKLKAITYYIPESTIEVGLKTTDWYRDICIAGAKQNGLDASYIAIFEQLAIIEEPENEAHKYLQSLNLDSKV